VTSTTTQGQRAEGAEGAEISTVVAQRLLFRPPKASLPDSLYVKGGRGTRRDRRSIEVPSGKRVSLNTYFGRFPAAYWQRWTTVRSVDLELRVRGHGMIYVRASDAEGRPRTVVAEAVEHEAAEVWGCSLTLDRFMDGGALWVEIEAEESALEVTDGRWTVPAPRRHRPTSVVVCTFNRADDCVDTLRTVADDLEALDMLERLYVVDQGTDAVESRPGFAPVKQRLEDRLHYLRQPNLGGAGGFTRGLYEVADVQHESHANVLFMDDDIVLEPDTVVRLTTFANSTEQPTIVGGQMLYLLHPDRLHVQAEFADLARLAPAQTGENVLQNVNVGKKQQDRRADAGYNGWWACLIPSEVVARVGYPLPLFFQWDDIEYGYRARAHGFPTVTLPGAGIWHADFSWKDWDDWHRYFNVRNSLITAALHSGAPARAWAAEMAQQLLRYTVSLQYGLAETALVAVEDFLAGPSMVDDGGVEAAARIRRLRAAFSETVTHAAAGLSDSELSGATLVESGRPSLPKAVLAKRLVQHLTNKPRGTAAVSAGDSGWWHVSLFRQVLVTDASQQGVRIRRYDRSQMLSTSRRAAAVLTRLVREGDAAAAAWKQAMPRLTGRENWKRLFESGR
jgi:galactofuranosylgalactofuranosylrhamnosyl-N-acetylglucosaminyl-diphospho-decaprenol beta-1,5/1,6-galactofuranosyltransferase